VDREQRPRQHVERPAQPNSDPERDPLTGLTPAEEHALRRSAPLKPPQFEELRRLADRGLDRLRRA
jgi:hypothetical protein